MQENPVSLPVPDFRALFEAIPGLYLVLLPDAPNFTIIAASDAYLRATMTERAAILGHRLFEIFPDNPNDPGATGVSNLRSSLQTVIQQRVPHTMDVQKYDIRQPEEAGGGFEERFWLPVNSPVLGADGEILYLLHRVEDVTELTRLEQQSRAEHRLTLELQNRAAKHALEEETLRASETLYRTIGEAVPDFIWVCKADGEGIFVNQRWKDYTGLTLESARDVPLDLIHHPDDFPALKACWRDATARAASYEAEFRYRRHDGVYRWFMTRVVPVKDAQGRITLWVGTNTDIHDRKCLEEQLLQAQKLESVGRLAGGVAHDFNNLLMAILGYGEMMQEENLLDAHTRDYLDNMLLAAEKASHLTGQLLAFARRQVIEPKVIDLNSLVFGLEKMLRRLIGEHIDLVMLPAEEIYSVRADPGQFEQILVNLVINGRDAMPDGGRVTIETYNAHLDAEYCRHHEGVVPGDYAVLAVSDTGTGIEEALRLHIFEPFFTTKAQGRGTGLGLATVYGIVKQAGGHIWLYSELGHGTTFKIYLPRTTAPLDATSAAPVLAPVLGGSETILIVEDEPAVRTLTTQALQSRGYFVWEATNGEEALQLVGGREQEIALLITDVIMPQMSGKEVADRLQSIHPSLKVLYASGYAEHVIVHHGVLEAGVAFLSKPFTPAILARKVRDILDQDIN